MNNFITISLFSNISHNAASETDLEQVPLEPLGQDCYRIRSVDIYSRQNVPGAIPDLRPSLNTDQRTSLITG